MMEAERVVHHLSGPAENVIAQDRGAATWAVEEATSRGRLVRHPRRVAVVDSAVVGPTSSSGACECSQPFGLAPNPPTHLLLACSLSTVHRACGACGRAAAQLQL